LAQGGLPAWQCLPSSLACPSTSMAWEPTTEAEEEAQLAEALARSLELAAPPPSAKSTRSVSSATFGDAPCVEGCGRRCAIGPDGRHFKTCCRSCAHLKKEKGFYGHDIECDIRDNNGLCPPWYWKSAARWPDNFHDEIGGEYVRRMGTKLLQRHLPSAEVLRADRIEDSELWRRYSARRAELRIGAGVSVEDVRPETLESIDFSAKTTLDRSLNEVYLLHGTSEDAARAIAQSNFRPSSSGCFGSGAYFADSASRSDTYARSHEDGTKIMLLCRVALGNIKTLECGQDREASSRLSQGSAYNSLLGTTAYGREFVVWDIAQVYPEYIMYYKKDTAG